MNVQDEGQARWGRGTEVVGEEVIAEKSSWRDDALEFECPFEELGLDLLSCASCQRYVSACKTD